MICGRSGNSDRPGQSALPQRADLPNISCASIFPKLNTEFDSPHPLSGESPVQRAFVRICGSSSYSDLGAIWCNPPGCTCPTDSRCRSLSHLAGIDRGAIRVRSPVTVDNDETTDWHTHRRASHSVGGSGRRDRLFGGMPSSDVVVELVVEDAGSDLQQAVSSGGGPAHLLFLDHPFRDDLVHGALGRR